MISGTGVKGRGTDKKWGKNTKVLKVKTKQKHTIINCRYIDLDS